ncbi:MAG: GIY-YIG nuclease family protein [Anaerolineales bacterium]
MKAEQLASVYIMTNKRNSVIYTGVTNDLIRRMEEHRTGKGFTRRYKVSKLVYVEVTERIEEAFEREKQIKAARGKRKLTQLTA